jgi:hypothetical protein
MYIEVTAVSALLESPFFEGAILGPETQRVTDGEAVTTVHDQFHVSLRTHPSVER